MKSLVIAALAIAIVLSGCAPIVTRVSWQKDRHGVFVQVLEIEGASCPPDLYAAPNDGCAIQEPVRVIFCRGEVACTHEREHVAGLVHGPWLIRGRQLCTTVLHSGNTRWALGDEICIARSFLEEIM